MLAEAAAALWQVLCGLLLALWSLLAFSFQGVLAWTGAALGLLCCGAGALGAVGSATGSLNTLNASVVAALLASALVAQHAGRAHHAGHVDCALAELSLLERSVRGAAERQAGSPHGQEALHAIKLRLVGRRERGAGAGGWGAWPAGPSPPEASALID